jgi:hypothetical protein
MMVCLSPAGAGVLKHGHHELERVNSRIHGHLVDHTHNSGVDRRIWSAALGQKRDLYVYLPPGYDPHKQYPFMMFLHGFAQDEQAFVENVAEPLDQAIVCGQLPPLIVAAPDGSLTGNPCLMTAGSFFINSKAGDYADFIMQDVWNFMFENYPLRPEREAHVMAGVSMGGAGAYNLAIKYRDRIKIVLGIFPPLNTRWIDCHGRYMSHFDPHCWGWRIDFSKRHEVVGRFYGVVTIHLSNIIDALYDRGSDIAWKVSLDNPIEMLGRLGVEPGQLCMYIGYAGRDQFNIAAQVESFLYVAKCRGLDVAVNYDPEGKHDAATAMRLFPGTMAWLAPLLAPYAPRCQP